MDRMCEEPHPQSSQSLLCTINHLDLLDAWKVKHPKTRQYTWVRGNSNRVGAARLDRIYISQSLSSRLFSSTISPVGFTDHHLVSTTLVTSPGEKAKSYWHFNNKLLQDNTFCQDFRRFWEHWRLQKLNFSSLRQWWEVGKAQTRVYCQQYRSYSTARIKTAVRELEADITHLEKELHGGSDPDTRRVLQEKRLELSSFLHERIKGALVRSRLLQLEHMDAPSSFFFNLEKSVAQRKQMTCLKLPGGRLTSNPSEMRRHAVDFYSDLFSAEDCNMEHREKLLDGLPQLAQEERAALDSPLTLEELTDVVNQMATGRAPGIDGLSSDFFKRLYTAQKLLYGCGSRWLDTSRLLLRRVGRFGYDKHLFFLRAEEVDCAGLTSFYYSVLQAWQVFKIERVNNDTPGMWVFEEPLFFNNFIRTQTLQSTSLRTSFREAGCTKVGHLMKMSRPSLTTLREATGIRSIRLLGQVMEEVLAALPKSLRVFVEQSALPDQWNDDCEYSFPSLLILPAAGEWQEGEGQILSFKIPQLSTFQGAGKKVIYQICVKVLNLRSLTGVKESRWTGFLGQDDSPKGSWRCLYKLPIEKRTADLQWRVVHGAIATNRYRARLDPSLGDQCVFCSQTETLEHLFIECPRL
ncbi:hypothetical protein Q8A73_010669 [Channa argus]|nr:hypothetical protein Q8A73_010669 [Channa argus]